MRARKLWRLGVVAAAVVATTLVTAGPAAAHVTVNPREAVQGGFTKLAFRVPNEKDTANTVKLEVVIPTQAPIAHLSVKPVPGWTATVDKTKLATPIKTDDGEVTEAISKITWTSTGADSAIKAGQFLEFEVSAGPLPEVDQIVFKALQTYSDGDVMRWIEEPAADGKEPEHPAPVLKLTKKTSATPSAGTAAQASAIPVAATDDNTSEWPLGIAIAALIAALAALGFAGLAWRRARPAPPTDATS
jgi:periplasmic copper chaperone A